MRKRITMISIDPGAGSTGVTCWSENEPVGAFAHPCRTISDWAKIVNKMGDPEIPFAPDFAPDVVIVTEAQTNNPQNPGSVAKLSKVKGQIVGYIACYLLNVLGCRDVIIRELVHSEWRKMLHGPGLPSGGDQKKEITLAWVKRAYPEIHLPRSVAKSKDVADSIGIGAAYLGVNDGYIAHIVSV